MSGHTASAAAHCISEAKVSPIGHQVFCSCGWSHFERRQNALARAAKMKAAIRKHLEPLSDDSNNGVTP